MSLLSKIISAVTTLFCKKASVDPFLPKNKLLVLRADGSWIIDDDKSSPGGALPKIPNIQAYPAIRGACHSHVEDRCDQEISKPPEFFPHSEELQVKLDACLSAGAISDCSHMRTKDNIYVLKIDIPYKRNDSLEETQVDLFIKAMNQKYGLRFARREKFSSSITCAKHHTIVFEYDPRQRLFLTKK